MTTDEKVSLVLAGAAWLWANVFFIVALADGRVFSAFWFAATGIAVGATLLSLVSRALEMRRRWAEREADEVLECLLQAWGAYGEAWLWQHLEPVVPEFAQQFPVVELAQQLRQAARKVIVTPVRTDRQQKAVARTARAARRNRADWRRAVAWAREVYALHVQFEQGDALQRMDAVRAALRQGLARGDWEAVRQVLVAMLALAQQANELQLLLLEIKERDPTLAGLITDPTLLQTLGVIDPYINLLLTECGPAERMPPGYWWLTAPGQERQVKVITPAETVAAALHVAVHVPDALERVRRLRRRVKHVVSEAIRWRQEPERLRALADLNFLADLGEG